MLEDKRSVRSVIKAIFAAGGYTCCNISWRNSFDLCICLAYRAYAPEYPGGA